MDLALADLETLLTVARERGFSRAAEKLRRTQPAISLAIQRLETACGETLLDRTSRPARLTDAGELAVRRAEQMLQQCARLELDLLELRGHRRGRITIGANESAAVFLLPAIARFRELHPDVPLEVRRSLSRHIPAEVLAGNLDLGMVAYDPARRELAATVLHRDRLAFVVYPHHPLVAASAPVPLRRLAAESFIAHNVDSPYRAFTVSEFRRRRVELRIDLEMPTIESIKRLVAQGLGVAFLPRISVAVELAEKSLVEVPVQRFRADRPLRLLERRAGRLSYAAAAFREVLCDVARTQ